MKAKEIRKDKERATAYASKKMCMSVGHYHPLFFGWLPLIIMGCCSLILLTSIVLYGISHPDQIVSGWQESPANVTDTLYLFFGLFACFGGLALFVVAFACRYMGIAGYKGLRWFSSFSLFGGLWCLFDPNFIFPFIPYPYLVYALSALCHHALTVSMMGYIRTCVAPRGAFLASIFIWIDACLLVAECVSQLLGGPTVFELSWLTVGVQLAAFFGFLAVFVHYARHHQDAIRNYPGLMSLFPCVVGLLVEALMFVTGGSLDGPWFGIGFVSTVTIQTGVFLRYIQVQAQRVARARELEQELAKNKMALMLSQIQPHFLFNALNTIQCLCETQPSVAAKTVNHFARYLRGNMDSLTQDAPISIERDLEHLDAYLAIEKLRFPDIVVQRSIKDVDFSVPALTLQPLVENAIRHGFNKCGEGGIVAIATWEENDAHCMSIVDDGVGFDVTQVSDDGRSHVGLRNTTDRLRLMCSAELVVESSPGAGTTICVRIPKENPDVISLDSEMGNSREEGRIV